MGLHGSPGKLWGGTSVTVVLNVYSFLEPKMLTTMLLARFFYSEKNENVGIYIDEIYVSQDGFNTKMYSLGF